MPQTLVPWLTSQFFDNNGAPLASGQLFSYQAGTSTPAVTYTDSTGGSPNTNPIILNARGEASVWISPNVGYKFVLQDSQSNIIWTRDQVINAQLLTLYGGVDTGVANAYILNFAAPYATLSDGIIVYWRAANTNTGSSTLNVNGLGVVPIVQQNGNPLGPQAIITNTIIQVMFIGGSWLLLSSSLNIPQSGSFTLTVNGLTNPSTVTATYTISNNTASITIPHIPPQFVTNASNSTQFNLTGLPQFLQPASAQQANNIVGQDNGAGFTFGTAYFNPGSSTIAFAPTAGGSITSWTASGTKVLGGNNLVIGYFGNTMQYSLI